MEIHRLSPGLLREIDRIAIEEYGIPSLDLMESAAGAVVDVIVQLQEKTGRNRAVIVLCGKGNNAGDGFAIARLLLKRQWHAIVVLFESTDFGGDARKNYRRLNGEDEFLVIMKSTFFQKIAITKSFLVDAIFGTGFRHPSKIDLRPINDFAQRNDHMVIAVDVPSGMDASDGTVIDENAIRADQTVTFVCEKTGYGNPKSKKWTGEVIVADIGIPGEIIEKVCKGKPSG